MEKQTLFNKSINILLKNHQAGTLNSNLCAATPVGHIAETGYWYAFFHTKPRSDFSRNPVLRRNDHYTQYTIPAHQNEQHKELLLASGYTIDELAQIEWAFEIAEDDLKGIFAIIDILIAIHSGSPEDSENAKSLFLNTPIRSE